MSLSFHLSGQVIAFNLSPKGHIEGVSVDTKTGPAQVAFHKHDGSAFARSMPVGSNIELPVMSDSGHGSKAKYVAMHVGELVRPARARPPRTDAVMLEAHAVECVGKRLAEHARRGPHAT
jgi:hypothetical protein